MASKKKDNYPSNAWEYVDWLYTSGRLTAEEHMTLKQHLLSLEAGLQLTIDNEGC